METKEKLPSPGYHWTVAPFFAVHLAAFVGVFLVPFRWEYLVLCIAAYYVRMFGITAGYHRYFAHRSYRTNRVFQFLLGFLGTTATQKGPLWWAGHHRHHHKYSDMPLDPHSPQDGFWWSHMMWFLSDRYNDTDYDAIKDFTKYPELVWLNKHFLVPPVLLAIAMFAVGGSGALVWGFFVSTVLLWHGTFTINSLCHVFGRRRFPTTDTSRNSLLLALITLGEGWHNNHHYYQSTANQGFYWWQLDGSYYALRVLSWARVVNGLRTPPPRILAEGRQGLVRLDRAQKILEWFPDSIRAHLANTEQLGDLLPKDLLDQLARAGRKLERLPRSMRQHLADGRKVLSRLPDDVRALLPSTDEILQRLRGPSGLPTPA